MKQAIAAAMLASAATTSWAAPAAQPFSVTTRLGMSTTTFSCETAAKAACHYLILNSLCQEKLVAGGAKERSCQYTQAVPPFQIKAGERKTVANLPADYVYTMKLGADPAPQDVLRSPVPH